MEQSGYWGATAPARPSYRNCELPDTVDCVVIGGGLTGLSAAYHLARAGVGVLVLEQEHLGWGASSRNGGMGIPHLNAGFDSLIAKHGILMVDFANKLQDDEGYGRAAAIEHAAAIRLRPILMTTAATVMAMVPLLVVSGAGAAARARAPARAQGAVPQRGAHPGARRSQRGEAADRGGQRAGRRIDQRPVDDQLRVR